MSRGVVLLETFHVGRRTPKSHELYSHGSLPGFGSVIFSGA
jgi:hypothetical protein